MGSSPATAQELDKMAKALSEMKGHHVRKATKRAIDRTLTHARKEAAKRVQKKENVSTTLIKTRTKIKKAEWKLLKGELHVYQLPIPLIALAKNNKGQITSKKVKGIKARRVRKKEDIRDVLGGTAFTTRLNKKDFQRFYHRAFINVVRRSGTVHVLQRHGKSTYKVRVPKIMIHKTFNKVLPQELTLANKTMFLKTLEHEYTQRLKGVIK